MLQTPAGFRLCFSTCAACDRPFVTERDIKGLEGVTSSGTGRWPSYCERDDCVAERDRADRERSAAKMRELRAQRKVQADANKALARANRLGL